MYIHLSNGDFNEEEANMEANIKETIGLIEFEIGLGQQWVLCTNRPLTDKEYSSIMDILKDRR